MGPRRVCVNDFYGWYTSGELRLVGFEPELIGFQVRGETSDLRTPKKKKNICASESFLPLNFAPPIQSDNTRNALLPPEITVLSTLVGSFDSLDPMLRENSSKLTPPPPPAAIN